MNEQLESWLKRNPTARVIWPFAVVFVLLIAMNSLYSKKKDSSPSGIEGVLKRVEEVTQPVSGRMQQAAETAGQVFDAGMRTIDKGLRGFEKEPEDNP